jgi:hypothetical protein
VPITKAISPRAEHALAVMYLDKRVENRSWPTRYRGPLYLHVSTKGRLTQSNRDEWALPWNVQAALPNSHLHALAQRKHAVILSLTHVELRDTGSRNKIISPLTNDMG